MTFWCEAKSSDAGLRPECANSGRSPPARRTGQVDPLLSFKIGPTNGREARESGLWPKASCANLRSSSDALPTLVARSKPLGQWVARVDVKVARGDRGAQVRQHSIRWSVRKSRPRLAFALALARRTA